MSVKFHKVSKLEWMKRKPLDASDLLWSELYDDIIIPQRKTRWSAGYDFHSPYTFSLAPGESALIETGIKIELNPNQVLLFFPRSSMGFKYFMRIANTIPVVDADYFGNPDNEGHIFIKIRNEGDKPMDIHRGEAFVQGVINEYCIVDEDSFDTGLGRLGGIGSTN